MPYWLWPNSCDPCQPCGETGQILLWTKAGDTDLGGTFFDFLSLLGSIANTDTDSNWTGDIDDYSLIVFIMPIANPSWWSSILTGWTGRIVLVGEFHTFRPAVTTYINAKTADTGMAISELSIDILCNNHIGTSESEPLMSGVTGLEYAATNEITGGTALSKTKAGGSDPGRVWLSQNKVGTIDWVVSGDSSFISDICAPDPLKFAENLWNVSV